MMSIIIKLSIKIVRPIKFFLRTFYLIINNQRKWLYTLNIFNFFFDYNYAEKLISYSTYFNHKFLFFALRKSEKFMLKKLRMENKIINKIELLDSLGRNYWYQGNYKKSMKYFEIEEKERENLIVNENKNSFSKIYLPRNTIHVLGLIGHMDAIIKYLKLNNNFTKIKIIGDRSTIINEYYFDLYREYVEIIDSKNLTEEEKKDEIMYYKNYHWSIKDFQGKYNICHKVFSESIEKWKKKNQESIIKINENEIEHFRDLCKKLNIKNKDKIITLHFREIDYSKSHNKKADKFRTSKIENYYDSINFLNSIGFFVVLIGENIKIDYTKIKSKNFCINYPNSNYRSQKNDIILINFSKYFIGCNSGPHWVASSLNKKFCLIDIPFNIGLPYYPNIIYLPLKYYKNNNLMSLKNIFNECVNYNFSWLFESANIKIVGNNSNNILLTIKEFLFSNGEIKDFKISTDNNLKNFHEEFKKLNKENDYHINGKIADVYFETLRN